MGRAAWCATRPRASRLSHRESAGQAADLDEGTAQAASELCGEEHQGAVYDRYGQREQPPRTAATAARPSRCDSRTDTGVPSASSRASFTSCYARQAVPNSSATAPASIILPDAGQPPTRAIPHDGSLPSYPPNVRYCRMAGVLAWASRGLVAAAMRWWLKPVSEGCVSTDRAADKMCSRRCGSAQSWRNGQPGPSTP